MRGSHTAGQSFIYRESHCLKRRRLGLKHLSQSLTRTRPAAGYSRSSVMPVTETEGVFVNERGQRLQTYAYVPQKPRCVIFFHHGFGAPLIPRSAGLQCTSISTHMHSCNRNAWLGCVGISQEHTQVSTVGEMGCPKCSGGGQQMELQCTPMTAMGMGTQIRRKSGTGSSFGTSTSW